MAWPPASTSTERVRHRRGAGFTLLELLVTLAIVGLLSGAAVLAIPDRSAAQQLRATATAVLADLHLAADEARVLGQPVRVQVYPHRLHFEVYAGSRWRDLPLGGGYDDGELRLARTHLRLHAHGHQNDGDERLLLLPDGSRKAFILELRLQQAGLYIEGAETGTLRLVVARLGK